MHSLCHFYTSIEYDATTHNLFYNIGLGCDVCEVDQEFKIKEQYCVYKHILEIYYMSKSMCELYQTRRLFVFLVTTTKEGSWWCSLCTNAWNNLMLKHGWIIFFCLADCWRHMFPFHVRNRIDCRQIERFQVSEKVFR